MMKKWLISAILIGSIFLNTNAIAQLVSPSVLEISRNVTVPLSITFKSSETGYCTGVVLKNTKNSGIILTAKHCTDNSTIIRIDNIEAVYYKNSPDNDLALIYYDQYLPNKRPVTISPNNIILSSRVYHLGYPRSKELFTNGIVSFITNDDCYAIIKTKPGCSGGGIFNTMGELVGIVWGSNGLGTAVFESLKNIKQFLQSANI